MALIKNNDIYIFAHLAAMLNLCKLYIHPFERCRSVIIKGPLVNILKYD